MTKTKKFLSMALILVFMIAFAAPVSATVAGTAGEPIINETFDDYEDGTLVTDNIDAWSTRTGDLKSEFDEMKGKFTIDKGKLVIAGGESTDTGNYGIRYTIGDKTDYQWGLASWREKDTKPIRKKADEYVFEFDAEIGNGAKLYFSNETTVYFQMWNLGNDNGKLAFVETGSTSKNTGYEECVFLPNGEHHFKIVLRSVCYKTVDGEYVALTDDEVIVGDTSTMTKCDILADIYVDGECYVTDMLAGTRTSKPHNTAILTLDIIHTAQTSTQSTFDNLKFYYLDGEKRSDAATRFLAVNNDSDDYTYLTLFEHTKPAERMNVAGSKLVAEIRYDGTQAAAEKVNVFLAQFGADGKLKSVDMKDATVTAGSTDKVTVTLESTADAPLFDADNIAEDDYLQAFVWTADGMVPLCDERTAGTIAE